MWSAGDQVVLRYRKGERISWVEPVTVVEDSDDCVALFMAIDTPIKRPVGLDGNPMPRGLPYEARATLPWRLGDDRWRNTSVLWLVRRGAAHAIGVFWRGSDWSFVGWYVNLQAPVARTQTGFDTEDHLLDVVVAPDLSWRWKDEDEFAAAQRIGRFTTAEAAAIRAEGEAAIAAIEARSWPYDTDWPHWRPDASWPVPALREGWDAIP